MDLNITEILEQLKAIENFASKVSETKKLADQLAENVARMKESLNRTMNQAFGEIADQIEQLRRNMETMETVQATSTSKSASVASSAPPLEPEPAPSVKEEVAAPPLEPEPAPSVKEEVAAPPLEPEPAPSVKEEVATLSVSAAETVETSPELEVLEQKMDKLKAALTDLRFDYMRGYIPEEEYKQKEADLTKEIENLERQISDLKK